MKSVYLERYAWPEPVLHSYEYFASTELVVVIPSYNELHILKALNSLKACHPPDEEVLVILIINEPENASREVQNTNQETYEQVKEFDAWFRLESVYLKLPEKKAGVGLSRKIGMDEAVRIFDTHRKDGIIICFDADCTCDTNYFLEIQKFYSDPKSNLGLVYYEHPLENQHPEEITSYELFLRYYINALRYSGYPHAMQTLGSCITVRSRAYEKQGGMNTRKAGEDFYFIHKLMPLGGIGEINNTCIYPSDRVSNRVPFGTGHAISKYLQLQTRQYKGYNPKTFQDLKEVFASFWKIYEGHSISMLNLPESCLAFYEKVSFHHDLAKILRQSNTSENFRKHFFTWWDGFRVLKFIHFTRDHFYPDVALSEAVSWLTETHLNTQSQEKNLEDQLLFFRQKDRETTLYIK